MNLGRNEQTYDRPWTRTKGPNTWNRLNRQTVDSEPAGAGTKPTPGQSEQTGGLGESKHTQGDPGSDRLDTRPTVGQTLQTLATLIQTDLYI